MRQLKEVDKLVLDNVFANPVFILSAPRSGSTLLFELLSQSPNFYSIGGESHKVYGQFPHLVAENPQLDSGSLHEKHADEVTARQFRTIVASMLINREREPLNLEAVNSELNFLEKTPRNALNIPFILKVFPQARFIFLHRDPRQNISSIIEAWETGEKTGRFVTYANLPEWERKKWCLLLPPGWRHLNGRPLVDIATFQWKMCNNIVLDQLESLDRNRWVSVSYDKLLKDPLKQVSRLCKFANVKCDKKMKATLSKALPLSATVVTAPAEKKWKRHEVDIIPQLKKVSRTSERLSKLGR